MARRHHGDGPGTAATWAPGSTPCRAQATPVGQASGHTLPPMSRHSGFIQVGQCLESWGHGLCQATWGAPHSHLPGWPTLRPPRAHRELLCKQALQSCTGLTPPPHPQAWTCPQRPEAQLSAGPSERVTSRRFWKVWCYQQEGNHVRGRGDDTEDISLLPGPGAVTACCSQVGAGGHPTPDGGERGAP